MTLLAFPCRCPDCSARNRFGSVNPPPSKVRAPAASVSRRVTPSQHRRGLPSMVSIGFHSNSRLSRPNLLKHKLVQLFNQPKGGSGNELRPSVLGGTSGP